MIQAYFQKGCIGNFIAIAYLCLGVGILLDHYSVTRDNFKRNFLKTKVEFRKTWILSIFSFNSQLTQFFKFFTRVMGVVMSFLVFFDRKIPDTIYNFKDNLNDCKFYNDLLWRENNDTYRDLCFIQQQISHRRTKSVIHSKQIRKRFRKSVLFKNIYENQELKARNNMIC